MTWEEVDVEENTYTDRLDVPGGWLYRTRIYRGGGVSAGVYPESDIVAVAMTFVPDV